MNGSTRRGAARWREPAVASLLLLAAVLTLHRLGEVPPGLFVDEAAISLTARSLWERGKDLGGATLPLYPLSFPDRAAPMPVNPLFTYTAIPFALAGPGPWSARLPAVLWLWVAAAGTGLCAYELTHRREVGLAIGLTTVLSPWLFVLGRIGWEAVSFPAVTALAFWCLLRAVHRGRRADFALAGALLGLSLYAYTTARLVAPLTAAAAALACARAVPARRHAWLLLGAAVVPMIPLGVFLLAHPGVLTWRFDRMNVLTYDVLEALTRLAQNYAGYFSPGFLILDGDPNVRHGTGHGVLPWAWVPLAGLGAIEAARRRAEPGVLAVLAGLLIAPVGASLVTADQPHAIRSITAAVFWGMLAALGLDRALRWSGARRGAVAALVLVGLIGLVGLADTGMFLLDYFGPYRARAFDAFDSARSAVLAHAFRVRSGRPLYVPEALHADVRHSVLLGYWGSLPSPDWAEQGLDAFGVHAWRGVVPPGSLTVVGWSGAPPHAWRPLLSVADPEGRSGYALIER